MTPAETLRSEIARLTRQRNEENILGWSNWDSDAALAAQIADLGDELRDAEPCPRCKGEGIIEERWPLEDDHCYRCPACNGTGRKSDDQPLPLSNEQKEAA